MHDTPYGLTLSSARTGGNLRIALLENLARDVANRLRDANRWIAALA